MGASMFRRTEQSFRAKALRASLAVAIVPASLLLASCAGEETGASSSTPAAVRTTDTAVDVSRAREYSTLTDLALDARLVVVGTPTGDIRRNPYYGDADTPFGIIDFAVSQTLFGQPDKLVQVSVEASQTNGEIRSDKLENGKTYLLFLTPQGPRSPSVYTIVGYKAGMFEESATGVFTLLDSESPKLPSKVSIDAVRAALP
jgi:hypothetical protein